MEAEDEITTLLIQTPLLSWWQPRRENGIVLRVKDVL